MWVSTALCNANVIPSCVVAFPFVPFLLSMAEGDMSSGCLLYDGTEVVLMFGLFQGDIHDIEELVSMGRELKACPYYASRFASPLAQVMIIKDNCCAGYNPIGVVCHGCSTELCVGFKIVHFVLDLCIIFSAIHTLLCVICAQL